MYASFNSLTGVKSPQCVQTTRPPFNRALSLENSIGSGVSVRNVNAFSILQKQNLMGGSPRMIETQEDFGANLGLLVVYKQLSHCKGNSFYAKKVARLKYKFQLQETLTLKNFYFTIINTSELLS